MTTVLLVVLVLLNISRECLCVLESKSFASPPPPGTEREAFRTFQPEETSYFKTLVISNDGQTLFVGASGKVFGRNLSDISKRVFPLLDWPSERKHSCKSGSCDNLIQVIHQLNVTHVVICGTNFMAPKNRLLVRKDSESEYVQQDENTLDLPLCSYDPNDSVTSLAVPSTNGSRAFFFTARSHAGAEMALIKQTFDRDTVLANKPEISADPRYVASFFAYDTVAFPSVRMAKVYTVSVETAHEMAVPIQRATVTQVCANDAGGSGASDKKWTTLLKLRLQCHTVGEHDRKLHFNAVTDMVRGVHRRDVLYGTFTTLHGETRSSAVCSFRIANIQAVFNSNLLRNVVGNSFRSFKGPIQDGQYLGMCAHEHLESGDRTSNGLADLFQTFSSKYNIMVKEVRPAYPSSKNTSGHTLTRGPLFLRDGAKFSKIAVQQATDAFGASHDVFFIATDTGRIHKVFSLEINNRIETVVLATYRPSNAAILSMVLSPSKESLYAGTHSAVYQLTTANCGSYTRSCEHCNRCRMCVLSRDPFCGWDTLTEKCISIQNGLLNTVKQDVYHGNADALCDSLIKTVANPARVRKGHAATLGHEIRSPSVAVRWWKLHKGNRELISEATTKCRINAFGQLKISFFVPGINSAIYEGEYSVRNITVAVWSHELSEQSTLAHDLVEYTLRSDPTPERKSTVKHSDFAVEAITGSAVAIVVFGLVLVLAVIACKIRRSNWSCSKHFTMTNQSRISPRFLTCVAAPAATQHFNITRAYFSLPGNPRTAKHGFGSSTHRDDEIDFLWIPGDQSKTMPRYLYNEALAFDLCGQSDATVSTIASSLPSDSLVDGNSSKIFV